MRGNITRRGKKSWRLKFDVAPDSLAGVRKIAYVTVKGTRQEAEQELTRRLASVDAGTFVEPSKTTLKEWLSKWLEGQHDISPKTAERYRELIDNQIVPHLGTVLLQRLRPTQVKTWHSTLLTNGRKRGGPLSARTVGHAHRVLHKALADAMLLESVSRNVVGLLSPPAVGEKEVDILTPAEIADVVAKLREHYLYPIVVLDLGTGLRRGELLALRWVDMDLDGSNAPKLRVERSLEETKAGGLRFKAPKTKHGRRTVSLPTSSLDALRAHRRAQLELRMALGLGKLPTDALVFPAADGGPRKPRGLSKAWSEAVKRYKLRRVQFHALRHTHASALIAAGVDVLTVSRRLGHANPTITLNTYSHLFANTDEKAATAIDAALGELR